MTEPRVAKLFKNGASQAVRLPADFRFEANEVYITRDDATGDVVLSTHPGARDWREFFDFVHAIEVPASFMAERPMNSPPKAQGVFDESVKTVGARKAKRAR